MQMKGIPHQSFSKLENPPNALLSHLYVTINMLFHVRSCLR